ncbi:hypothetical protein GCM10010259_09810 [Streptomyces daghestanicus]|uniref:Uncharacterized protein n=1 Tax=Streptomyces daghestanicus TaxID=66885 RepID=A0ABQ3Q2K2_9ACTN|nr:hypothetical protein GCM10010240_29030 [Streptomyces griseoviridis]GGU21566.1 hypothetical protein GCM10010259_09810 [Streptomyces daghestanicus]GHI31464.1 hypothetical protein Sdagh_31940 [Streptomyces daghestanicus]
MGGVRAEGGARLTRRREGPPAARPPLPGPCSRHCGPYFRPVRELIDPSTPRGTSFAAPIRAL